jgi:hypothetical protein
MKLRISSSCEYFRLFIRPSVESKQLEAEFCNMINRVAERFFVSDQLVNPYHQHCRVDLDGKNSRFSNKTTLIARCSD